MRKHSEWKGRIDAVHSLNMNKFNKQFNSKIKRLNKWQDVTSRLSAFEGLLHSFDGLNPREVVSLKIIHKKLYEAYSIAKKRKQEVLHDIQEHIRSMGQSH